MSIEIGSRLRSLRKARGLSQEAVARQTNIGLKAYGDLERGRTTDPHYSTLEGIAHALGTTVAELVGEESEASAVGKGSASRESGQPSAAARPRSRAAAVPNLAMPEETFLALADDQINEIFKALEEGRIPIEPARENVKNAVRQLVKQGSRPS